MNGFDGPHSVLTFKEYEEVNKGTDKNTADTADDLQLPLVGLFGETGSLVTLYKKKWRDKNAYPTIAHDLLEEMGDLLWYLTNVSRRVGTSLEEIARDSFSQLKDFRPKAGLAFSDIDRLAETQESVSQQKLVASLATLGSAAAQILATSGSLEDFKRTLPPLLSVMLKALVEVSVITDTKLNDAALANIGKTLDRWPIEVHPIALFDDSFNEHEQLPRKFTVEFQELQLGSKTYVYQKFNNVHVGDRLTDNIVDSDFYRFHDAFHWTYAAVLGWSPVTRGLLRCKRKEKPDIDENEDGARAAIIEEAIAVWIFHQAKDPDINFFENITSLDFHVLKAVHDLTRGYEAEKIPLWLWERAILDSYKIFRELKRHRNGFIDGDLSHRTIAFRSQ